VTETELDAVFLALASSMRRRMLDIVAASPGCTINQVAEHFDMSRVGVLKHINVLEDAGLLLSEKVGRERPLHFNPVPLQLIYERWSDRYRSFWAGRLTRLKYAIEQGKGR
jgi:DNA-binding transcriptional ArsR family regulator